MLSVQQASLYTLRLSHIIQAIIPLQLAESRESVILCVLGVINACYWASDREIRGLTGTLNYRTTLSPDLLHLYFLVTLPLGEV